MCIIDICRAKHVVHWWTWTPPGCFIVYDPRHWEVGKTPASPRPSRMGGWTTRRVLVLSLSCNFSFPTNVSISWSIHVSGCLCCGASSWSLKHNVFTLLFH